eukprot:scaffold4079_cov167-Amphora_coffeaeformis.AAC.12
MGSLSVRPRSNGSSGRPFDRDPAERNFHRVARVISKTSKAKADLTVEPGDRIVFGVRFLEVRATPGHTEGCVSSVAHDKWFVLTGDALLIHGCGRTDFQGGSPENLYDSVHTQLFSPPKSTIVYPAHDYKGRFSSTIGAEIDGNPRLGKDKTKEDFVNIMANLNLAYTRPEREEIEVTSSSTKYKACARNYATTSLPVTFLCDLLTKSKKHLAFLQALQHEEGTTNPSDPHAREALRWYRSLWLPMIAEEQQSAVQENGTAWMIIVPSGVAWMWHCHRLLPAHCEAYYLSCFGNILNPQTTFSVQSNTSIATRKDETIAVMEDHTRKVWNNRYAPRDEHIQHENVQSSVPDVSQHKTAMALVPTFIRSSMPAALTTNPRIATCVRHIFQLKIISCLLLLLAPCRTEAFICNRMLPQTRHGDPSGRSLLTRQKLLPLTSLSDDLSFLKEDSGRYPIFHSTDDDHDASGIDIFVPEEDDLPNLSEFVVQAFGADTINLSQDFNQVEQFILQPVAEFLNGYSGLAAYTEVLAGLRQRLKTRLQKQSVDLPVLDKLDIEQQIRETAGSSILFVLAKANSQQGGSDMVASVELRLELTDGKIPFTMPWLDRAERYLASLVGVNKNEDLQPYLSSLCVDEKFRKQGLGRVLVHCCEDVARVCWKCDRLYLHVDPDNTAAVQLYLSEGYKEVNGVRWNPFWAGPAANIGYYVKELS